jgi:hypothetical protein
VTRHPKLGAAERRPALYRNQKKISGLEKLRRWGAPEVPIGELVENKREQLKRKTSAFPSSAPLFYFAELLSNASRAFKTKYCLRGGRS